MLPTLDVFLNIFHLLFMKYRTFNTFAFLGQVVVQQAERIFSQQDDGSQVADSHECHSQVGKVLYNAQMGQ